MIEFLLREVEKTSTSIFSKNELHAISPEQFQELVSQKILTFSRPIDTSSEKIRNPCCPHGCYLTVIDHNGDLEAYCEDHPAEGSITVDKDDLLRYKFSVENLLKKIAQINSLSGNIQELDGEFLHIGYTVKMNRRIGFIFVQHPRQIQITSLLGLLNQCKTEQFLIVLTPITFIDNVDLESRAFDNKLFLTSIWDAIDCQGYRIVSDRILSLMEGFSEPEAPTIVFQEMDGLSWNEVSMSMGNEYIKISVRDKTKRFNYAEIGFKDGRKTNTPNQLWDILSYFARYNGQLNWEITSSHHIQGTFKAKLSNLRRQLKGLFGIESDPFYPYRTRKAYVTRFQIKEDSNPDPYLMD